MLRKILFSIASLTVAMPAAAAQLSSDQVTFRTDKPQNALGTGAAETRSGSLTLPLPFEGEVKFDLIAGSDRTPNPDWLLKTTNRELALAERRAAQAIRDAVRRERERINKFIRETYPVLLTVHRGRLGTWQSCRRLLPKEACGARPRKPTKPSLPPLPPALGPEPSPVDAPQFIDTRQGHAGEIYVKGQAELELLASATLGQVDPVLSYNVVFDAPETLEPGTFFHLDVQKALVSGNIDGTTPSFKVVLDQIMKIDDGRIQLTECILVQGCTTSQAFDFEDSGTEVRTQLVEITPVEAVFFGDSLPETMMRAGAPVLRLEAVVSVDIDADDPQNPFSVSVNGIPLSLDAGLSPGISTDVATIIGQVPHVEVAGDVSGSHVSGEERSDYLGFSLDVDAIAQLPGGATVGNVVFSLSADLWDVEAGPQLDIYQGFDIAPDLRVILNFEPAVMVEGQDLVTELEVTETMPRIAVTGPTHVQPEYRMTAEMRSQMGYQAAGGIKADLIKGSVNSGPLSLKLGPVTGFEAEWVPGEARLPLFDKTFPLKGFDVELGTPFEIGAR